MLTPFLAGRGELCEDGESDCKLVALRDEVTSVEVPFPPLTFDGGMREGGRMAGRTSPPFAREISFVACRCRYGRVSTI